jgi:hypothetical protein
MSRMRGVDPFSKLWKRREELRLPGVGIVGLLALPDLVKAMKTQRDKDWPMIRRLIEADVARRSGDADDLRVDFWMRECRTVNVLRELARRYPEAARRAAPGRPALRAILQGGNSKAAAMLRKEVDAERARDRRYWAPLRRELEKWRLGR